MKKLLLLSMVVLSAVFSINLFADDRAEEEAVFTATIKEVDLGGSGLFYTKVDDLDDYIDDILSMVIKNILKNEAMQNDQKQQTLLVLQSLKAFVAGANLGQVEAYASSVKTVSDDMIVGKSFIYTEKAPKNFAYGLLGNKNVDLTSGLSVVPEDVLYAVVGETDYTPIVNELNKNALIVQFLQLFEVQFGISVNQLANSMIGVTTLTFDISVVNESPSFDLYVRIPDKNKAVAKVLMTTLNTQTTQISIPVDEELTAIGIAPIVYIEDGYIVFVTNENVYKKAQNVTTKNIANSKSLQKYTKNMSKLATAKVYFNLNDEKAEILNNLFESQSLYDIDDVVGYGEVVLTDKGYKIVVNASDSFDILD